jgi:two-component system, OmpR family, KDP operon response regulator KdpE
MSAPEKKKRILVIDDEEQIRRALKSILASRQFEVAESATGEEGYDAAVDFSPDLIILDMALPGMSGLEVCRALRSWTDTPILILSVLGADADKIAALDLGADDYITKPFSTGELMARVRALLRRSAQQVKPEPIINIGDLMIDIPRRVVSRKDKDIDLTRIEFDLLAYLAQNMDRVITSKMLLEQVWGPDYGSDNQTLRVHISHLRKKIESHPAVPRHILTEPGIGYRFES